MPRVVEFDFSGAPPAQGGGQDYVPPGRHAARIDSIIFGKSKAGSPMVTTKFEVLTQGHTGKRITDYMVVAGERKTGLQRFHAMLLALKLPISERAVKLDLDKLIDQRLQIGVVDELQAASERYAERTVSRINSFYTIEGADPIEAAQAAATNGASAQPVPAADPAPAPVAAAPAAPAAAPVAVAEPVAVAAAVPAANADSLTDDIDDLFK